MSEFKSNPWRRTAVRCWSGYKAIEKPLSFLLEQNEIKVRTILGSWREPDYLCFKVQTEDYAVYDLRHHEYEDVWELRLVTIHAANK